MSKDAVLKVLKQKVLEILPELPTETITFDKSLKELGANSIDRMDIIVKTMEALEIKLPMVETAKATNIGDLVELFSKCKERFD